MRWFELLYILLVFGSAMIAGLLAFYAWHQRAKPGAIAFAGLMAAIMEWAICGGLLAVSPTPEIALFWHNSELLGVSVAAVMLLSFALYYTGRGSWLTWPRLIGLAIIPLLFQILVWTNPRHHWCFASLRFVKEHTFFYWDMTPAWFFWVHAIYAYALVGVSMLLIGFMAARSFQFYRRQAFMLFSGMMIIIITSGLDTAQIIPGFKQELSPIGFTVMGVTFALAFFRYQLFEVVPVARATVIDRMSDGMLVVDLHHRIVDLNPAIQRMLGLLPAQVIGQSLSVALSHWPACIDVIVHNENVHTELPLEQQSVLRYYALRLSPLRDQRGRLTGKLLIVHDVTERKRAENQLLKLQQAIETSEVGITITDIEGRIEYTNPAEARMHGYTVEELRGRPANLFATPAQSPNTGEDAQRQPEEIYINWKRERLNIKKGGRIFPVTLISNPIYDEQGTVIGKVTICEDITERKQADAALLEAHTALQRKNTELQELNASKDRFFSIISHDLRSPLGSMLGFAQLLDDHFETYPPEKQHHFVGRIHASAERLSALLENLLTWARLQRGNMECRPESLALSQLAEENIALFAEKAVEKQIALTNTLPNTLSAYADRSMIDTVLRNLISNALKFTTPGGRVTISGKDQTTGVEIAVTDTGAGIEANDLDKLFRMDVQTTRPGTAGEQGTGLGLLLCRELMERNAGTISVKSTRGVGTTFRLSLPITTKP